MMSYLMTFLAGGILGGIFGVFTMCAMVAAGEADDREERWFDGRHDKQTSNKFAKGFRAKS